MTAPLYRKNHRPAPITSDHPIVIQYEKCKAAGVLDCPDGRNVEAAYKAVVSMSHDSTCDLRELERVTDRFLRLLVAHVGKMELESGAGGFE